MPKFEIDTTNNDFAKRYKQARARAQWEIGDPVWAGVIIGAFLYPEADKEALDKEKK